MLHSVRVFPEDCGGKWQYRSRPEVEKHQILLMNRKIHDLIVVALLALPGSNGY